MNWCIVSNEALSAETTNELIQTLKDGGCDVGVCHDDANRVFTSTPAITPELEQYAVRAEFNEDTPEQALIVQVGAFLKAKHLDKILVADRAVFAALFDHPVHRLWCGNYEDKHALTADFKAAFGVTPDSDKNLDLLTQEGRRAAAEFINIENYGKMLDTDIGNVTN